jgi:hypothetical protein
VAGCQLGLRHEGGSLLSVGKDLSTYLGPSDIPAYTLLVKQDPHQLGDGKGGMSIVHLDTDVIGKSNPREVKLGEPPQDILQTSRSPEVLLLKSKQFTLVQVVVGVQHLSDVADLTRGVDTGFVVSGIEGVEVKARNGGSFPESDIGAVLGGVSGNRSVVRNSVTFHSTGPNGFVGVGDILDLTVESDRVGDIVSSNLPWLTSVLFMMVTYVFSVKPRVRCFKLFTGVG